MIQLEVGLGEIVAILGAVVGLAWALLKMTLAQFEKRLAERFQAVTNQFTAMDNKFKQLDTVLLDVKKLELEQLRRDGQYALLYVTKEELLRRDEKADKVSERIFNLLSQVNDKLDSKVDHTECDRLMMRKTDRAS